jgi:hypothetical protein
MPDSAFDATTIVTGCRSWALASFQDGAAAAAIIGHGARDVPWQDELVTVIKRHSRDPD